MDKLRTSNFYHSASLVVAASSHAFESHLQLLLLTYPELINVYDVLSSVFNQF